LSNATRLYGEAVKRFPSLVEVDREEAITNLDLEFEAKLDTFPRSLRRIERAYLGFSTSRMKKRRLLMVL
jgi:hypothetical protein